MLHCQHMLSLRQEAILQQHHYLKRETFVPDQEKSAVVTDCHCKVDEEIAASLRCSNIALNLLNLTPYLPWSTWCYAGHVQGNSNACLYCKKVEYT